MVMHYPIILENGRPFMATGDRVLEQSLEAVLDTKEGSYFVDRRYGVSFPLFGPSSLDAAQIAFEVSEELLERLPEVVVDSVDILASGNEVNYQVQVSTPKQVIKVNKQVLL